MMNSYKRSFPNYIITFLPILGVHDILPTYPTVPPSYLIAQAGSPYPTLDLIPRSHTPSGYLGFLGR